MVRCYKEPKGKLQILLNLMLRITQFAAFIYTLLFPLMSMRVTETCKPVAVPLLDCNGKKYAPFALSFLPSLSWLLSAAFNRHNSGHWTAMLLVHGGQTLTDISKV